MFGGEDAVAENGQIIGQTGNGEIAVVVLDQLDLHRRSGQLVGHSDQGMGEQGFWCNGLTRRILQAQGMLLADDDADGLANQFLQGEIRQRRQGAQEFAVTAGEDQIIGGQLAGRVLEAAVDVIGIGIEQIERSDILWAVVE